MNSTDVLVVGAGPVGLTAAAELRRHGVECRIIDRLRTPPRYAKAVGIQPRTLEIWEDMGLLRTALDAASELSGQLIFVNGQEVARMELSLPADVPYGFLGLPQYETERILAEHLALFGTRIERGVELATFEQDADGVTATLAGSSGTDTIRARYLIGCDGAHSTVRKGLGLRFEGGAFPEAYMLGDVEVDWSLPTGFAIRASHQSDGQTDDLLVCIPLPGRNRYRMSMLVPKDMAQTRAADDTVAHGFESGKRPELHHIQAVLDRLSPERTVASNLRWSSIFRISHRIVDRYASGRVFVAGDAAHIHPPTGAQGMNTGIHDACNLAWKLALAVRGIAAPGLLESYDAERRPIGEEVVGRTVRHAREGFERDPDTPEMIIRREAQLLVGYRGSPLVEDADGAAAAGAPQAGDRAPDARGLTRGAVAFPLRLFEFLRGPRHKLLLYADATVGAQALRNFEQVAARATETAHGDLDAYAVLAPEVDAQGLLVPVIRDRDGAFRQAYAVQGACACVVRPDGYIGYRASSVDGERIAAHLGRSFSSS